MYRLLISKLKKLLIPVPPVTLPPPTSPSSSSSPSNDRMIRGYYNKNFSITAVLDYSLNNVKFIKLELNKQVTFTVLEQLLGEENISEKTQQLLLTITEEHYLLTLESPSKQRKLGLTLLRQHNLLPEETPNTDNSSEDSEKEESLSSDIEDQEQPSITSSHQKNQTVKKQSSR
uniref:Uncharacterized protein n=1 Tax=Strongyloides stercoralis TaxID=6248 RepID=A0AAF5DKS8_STRER